MKTAVLSILLGIFLLFGVGLVANFEMFRHITPVLVDKTEPPAAPGEMSWKTYKRVKLELGSFDLVNGLTKHDMEAMRADNNVGFYYLIACLWLVLGMRLGLRRPAKKSGPPAGP
jgi:hypothetical protein